MAHDAVVFDAYGTLFDVTAAARAAAEAPGRAALAAQHETLSRIWREKQIGYTWWRSITGTYTSFEDVTREALAFALEATGLDAEEGLEAALMALYRTLDAYPEAADVLDRLRNAGRHVALLSNGSPEMLSAATQSADLASRIDTVLSVEEVGVFKPSSKVYDLVEARTGVAPARALFVSSNGWDIAAAAGYGFDTVWVNRAGLPMDRLPFAPARTMANLTTIPDIANGVLP